MLTSTVPTRAVTSASCKFFVLFCVCTVLAACTNQTTTSSVVREAGVSTVVYPESGAIGYIKGNTNPAKFCGARDPDIAADGSSGVSLSIAGQGSTETLADNATTQDLSLGGRSPAVLIVREVLYRACEMSLNMNSDATETRGIYRDALEIIPKILSNNLGVGTAASSTAQPQQDLGPSDADVQEIDDQESTDYGESL